MNTRVSIGEISPQTLINPRATKGEGEGEGVATTPDKVFLEFFQADLPFSVAVHISLRHIILT